MAESATVVPIRPLAEPRSPVTNQRWRGRFPPNVINRRGRAFWTYLGPGDEAELFTFGSCHGKRVRVLRFATAEEVTRCGLEDEGRIWFAVEAVGYKFPLEDFDNGKQVTRILIPAKQLRRIREVAHG